MPRDGVYVPSKKVDSNQIRAGAYTTQLYSSVASANKSLIRIKSVEWKDKITGRLMSPLKCEDPSLAVWSDP